MRSSVRVAVIACAVLALGQGATAQQDVEDKLEDTRDQLDDARSTRDQLQVDTGNARVALADADSRLAALELQLREREAELVAAQTELDAANEAAGQVNADLILLNGELSQSRTELAATRDAFDDRVAAAYKHGGALPYAEALLRTRDISELATVTHYVRAILRADRRVIDGVADETAAVAAARSDVDSLRESLAAEQAIAAVAQDNVSRATTTHRVVTAMVAEERQARSGLVTDLEGDLATYTVLVTDLEAQSTELAAELARLGAGVAPIEGDLLWPTAGRAGSPFGYRTHPIFGSRRLHAGVDVAGPTGQPIIAVADGTVVSADRRGGYGLAVVIDHGGGLATLYAHQSVLAVSAGEFVGQGQKIGEVGSTGFSTGPHLHYEVRVKGTPQDPMAWYG